MKKKAFLASFLLVTLVCLAMMPVMANAAQAGSAVLPIIDPGNDVYHSDDASDPLSGPLVSTHPQVDILGASLHPTNPDLCVEFNGTPVNSYPYYSYSLTIGKSYIITNIYTSGSYALVKLVSMSELQYWNPVGSTWTSTPTAMHYTFSGHNITYEDVQTAIPDIASQKVTVMAIYVESSSSIYTDVAPMNEGIPGFPFLFVLVSILTLMGLILLFRKFALIEIKK